MASRKKRVLFVMNSLSTGGAEKVLSTILTNLDRGRFEPELLTIFPDETDNNSIPGDVPRRVFCEARGRYAKTLAYKLMSRLCSPGMLYRMMVRGDYDVEIAFLEGLPTKIISGGVDPGIRRVAWVHTDMDVFRGSDYCFKGDSEQYACYRAFDCVVAVSRGAADAFGRRFPGLGAAVVLYNPVDEVEVRRKASVLADRPAFSGDGCRFVAVGRLHPQKGFDVLLDACALLAGRGVDFELVIVGEGAERGLLEGKISALGLGDNVCLYGGTDNPYQLMAQADCLVMSSRTEGFPLVCVEALIVGLPVVATDVTGPSEVLEHGKWGMLVRPEDAQALAGGMQRMCDPSERGRLAGLARERATQFSVAGSMAHIEELIDGL